MKSNVGGLDRIARIVVGVVLIALAATQVIGWWGDLYGRWTVRDVCRQCRCGIQRIQVLNRKQGEL